jgi:hypothetical protein
MSSKHTPGPWRWEFNSTHKSVELCGGTPAFDKTVMDFTRWGMSGASPRFMGDDGGFRILHRLQDRKDWIAAFSGREHHQHWFATVTHPDARLIAAAPELLSALQVAEMALRERGLRACGEYKQIEAAIAKATGEA